MITILLVDYMKNIHDRMMFCVECAKEGTTFEPMKVEGLTYIEHDVMLHVFERVHKSNEVTFRKVESFGKAKDELFKARQDEIERRNAEKAEREADE